MTAEKAFRPLLARALEPGERLPWPMLASPKLDGIRCVVLNGVAHSRSLKPLPNRRLATWLDWKALEGLDGELIVGDPTAPDAYNKTTSVVMSDDAPLDGLRFHVFDWIGNPAEPYCYRIVRAGTLVDALPVEVLADGPLYRVALVPTRQIGSMPDLERMEAEAVNAGYEGLMIRAHDGKYKFGRTAGKGHELLKVKRFEDSEAEILAAHPLMRNGNEQTRDALGLAERSTKKAGMVADDLLGRLDVRDLKSGIEFSIGGGFTEALRRSLWEGRDFLPGQIVKYKHQPAGVKEAPRFPVFLGFRARIDL